MTRSERIQRLIRLVPLPMMLFAAACGGGDSKSPTGPSGPGDEGQGPDGGSRVEFQLSSLGLAGLPADAEVEDCQLTRFYGGTIAIDPNSGEWQIDLKVHDDSGDWHFRDYGGSEGDGTTVLFDSQVSQAIYQGTVNGDASEIKIMYDWCANGVPDIQLVFDR
jgi:hypothetical protein